MKLSGRSLFSIRPACSFAERPKSTIFVLTRREQNAGAPQTQRIWLAYYWTDRGELSPHHRHKSALRALQALAHPRYSSTPFCKRHSARLRGTTANLLNNPQRPPQRCHIDAEQGLDGGTGFLARVYQLPRVRHLLRRQFARTTDMFAPPPGRSHAGFRPLADHFALEFGQRRQNVEIEPAARACRVDMFLERRESDPCIPQAIDDLDQLGKGPRDGRASTPPANRLSPISITGNRSSPVCKSGTRQTDQPSKIQAGTCS